MKLYRKIVRENISGVLQSVFPLFCRSLDEADIHQLADAFIQQHQASQPEFHQVATELLLFMRDKGQLSARDLALVEYEWLTYAVEIDDSEVPLSQFITLHPEQLNGIEVELNPTLKIIALPFWLKEGELYYEEMPLLYYYALYRKHNNVLYQKRLSLVDVQLLSELNDRIMMVSLEQLKNKAARYSPELHFHSWLVANNNDELLSLKFKG